LCGLKSITSKSYIGILEKHSASACVKVCSGWQVCGCWRVGQKNDDDDDDGYFVKMNCEVRRPDSYTCG